MQPDLHDPSTGDSPSDYHTAGLSGKPPYKVVRRYLLINDIVFVIGILLVIAAICLVCYNL